MAAGDTPQASTQVRVETRFKAFVSYSHADQAAAQRLHRKLEAYRLPKHLRADASQALPSDGRIGAIFRDREDLPAAEDLSESVKAALSASEALVVLCSPDAQKSPWVAREIELFREIHPDRPVLAAILRGDPSEAFPEPLTQGREPLAADLRKEGDGPRLGFLKVVAGIAGVPLDTLINRDAQRRVRRVTAITVAAVAAMVVMALMTTFALQARDEAQRQRAEAEGLIEYMLTDLREDLAGTADLGVMTKVNKRALAFYRNQQNLNDLPADSLERRARAIGQLGEDAQKRKDYALARQNFQERWRITSRLLASDTNNQDRQFDHARSLNWLAILAETEGKSARAEEHLRNSWELLSKINAEGSNDPERRRAVTLVAGNLCALSALRQETSANALAKCELAVGLGRKLAQQEERASLDPYNLVFNLMWYGDMLALSGQKAHASTVREEALKMSDRLVEANPSNLKIVSQRMELYGYLSRYRARVQRRDMLDQAALHARWLTNKAPSNAEWADKYQEYIKRLGELK